MKLRENYLFKWIASRKNYSPLTGSCQNKLMSTLTSFFELGCLNFPRDRSTIVLAREFMMTVIAHSTTVHAQPLAMMLKSEVSERGRSVHLPTRERCGERGAPHFSLHPNVECGFLIHVK